MTPELPSSETERRKQVKLRVRPDLSIQPQRYEGRTYYVVKDPVSLRYFRFKEQEHFLLSVFDGKTSMDAAQKAFEKRFRPERLTLEDLEQFGMQLMTVGLAQNESPQAGQQLYEHRRKRKRTELLQALTNILYIKIPIFDPEKLLLRMLPYFRFMFTNWFFIVSVSFMLGAVLTVAKNFELFLGRLPSYQEFFNPKTLIYLWAALGVVKVIHEFGHGLSCKHFGGEVHEMGFLILCLSPAMYCNVSDSWTMPNKWHRIIISFAGIYVELMIAALSTFIWWNTSPGTFVNQLSLSLMIVCSVNTVVFNGNPLMRFDGYYVLADWLEIPNLRDRANKYLQRLGMEYLLGIEVQPEPYMALGRRCLFVIFGMVSYVYRWVITFVLLRFLATFLRPYKLEVISSMLAMFALGSMLGWPLYRLISGVNKRGRLPDMKTKNMSFTGVGVGLLLIGFFFLPLPVSRVRTVALVEVRPHDLEAVPVEEPGYLKAILVQEGEFVRKGKILAEFSSLDLENSLGEVKSQKFIKENVVKDIDAKLPQVRDERQRQQMKEERARAEGERAGLALKQREIERSMGRLILRARRDGVVMGLPPAQEVGKLWDTRDKDSSMPFCSIGDPQKLRALAPVPSLDYDLVRENLKALDNSRQLGVTIRVQGLAENTWRGHVSHLPEDQAKTIPFQLSTRGGGPLALQPGSNELKPQSQVYLIGIDIDNPDASICPGTLGQVKIHCRYRSCAWWVWRTLSATFDLGLL